MPLHRDRQQREQWVRIRGPGAHPVTGILYGTGARGDSGFYVVDPTTGAGTLIGNPSSGVHSLTWSPDGTTLYAVSFGSFGTVDPDSGEFTFLSSAPDFVHGMAFDPGTDTLYAVVGRFSGNLYTVDPSTGAFSFVTPLSRGYFSLEFLPNGNLLAGGNDGGLYTIDPATGGETLIGYVGFDLLLGLESVPNADSQDWYSFTLSAGQTATLAVEGAAALNLELVRSDGTVLALGTSAGNLDQVINDFLAPSTGQYFVRISGQPRSEYNLVVTRNVGLDTAQDVLSTSVTGAQWVLGYAGDDGSGSTKGSYRVTLAERKTLQLETTLPAAGSGEFVNNLDPMVRVYDPSGNLVASNDNSGPDKRNAKLNYNVPRGGGGTYTVEVLPSDLTAQPTQGEYILSIKGATRSLPPFQVVATDPADGDRLRGPTTQMTVDFNDTLLLTSLQAADLTVNGVPAVAVTVVDANTVAFGLPAISEGTQSVQIAAGAIQDIQGTPLEAFGMSFFEDFTAPRVVDQSVAEGTVLNADSLAYSVTFSEPMNTVISDSAFELYGVSNNTTYGPDSFSFDASGSILTINYSGLPQDTYRLTLFSGDAPNGFQDLPGFRLDGEVPGALQTTSNTGADSNGNLLADGDIDPSYTIVSSPDGTGPATYVTFQNAFPFGYWMPDGPDSKWISPTAEQSSYDSYGQYDYQTTVDLTGYDAATAVLTGRVSQDDILVDILVNGVSTGISDQSNLFYQFTPYRIGGTFFQPGLNTIDFLVFNSGGGPTGLRNEMTLVAAPISGPTVPPDPSGDGLPGGNFFVDFTIDAGAFRAARSR